MTKGEQKDWELVVSFLAYSGKNRHRLTAFQDTRLRFKADGFGDLRGADSDVIQQALYDWSHVRDSSHEAIANIANAIRQEGYEDQSAQGYFKEN